MAGLYGGHDGRGGLHQDLHRKGGGERRAACGDSHVQGDTGLPPPDWP